jgi:hypothetical protein
MEVHLIDLLEVASMHELLLLLRDIPQPNRTRTGAPNMILLLSAPHQLRDLPVLLHLEQTLTQITDIPQLYGRIAACTREDVAVEGRELYRI